MPSPPPPSGMLIRATRVPLDRIADLISANQILLVAACTDSCADYKSSIHPSCVVLYLYT